MVAWGGIEPPTHGFSIFPENGLDQRYLRIEFYKLISDNGIALEQTLGKYEIL